MLHGRPLRRHQPDRVALSRHDAARAGFDYQRSYGLLAVDPLDWEEITVEHVQTARAWEPFERFLARRER